MPGSSLQLNEDMAFQKREWHVERAGWVIIAALLLLAALGVFGGGWLSRSTVRSGDFEWQYPRFERVTRATQLRARLPVVNGEAALRLDHAVLDALEVRSVVPPPDEVVNTFGGTEYRFRSSERTLTVSITAAFEQLGRVRGQVGVPNGTSVKFTSFVYP